MLNSFYIFGIYWIVNRIFNKNNYVTANFYLFFIVSINLVCLLPVSMSDLVSMFMFFIGLYFLLEKIDLSIDQCKNKNYFFLSGLFFAFSFLLKQNYGVFGAIITLIYLCVNFRILIKNLLQSIKMISYFSFGFSVVLIQFLAIYYKFHIFGFFVPIEMIKTVRVQPYIEAFGYTNIINSTSDLSPGFYFTVLDSHVNQIIFYLYKIVLGLSHVDLMIYHGERPTITNIVHLNFFDYFKIIVFTSLLAVLGCVLYLSKKISAKYRVLFTAAIIISIFIALTFHVENRYYILPRILILCLLLPFLKIICNGFVKKK